MKALPIDSHVDNFRSCIEQHSDRIKLVIGVLKSFSRHCLNDLKALSNNGIGSYQYDSALTGSPWVERFDMQDLQILFGLDFGHSYLNCQYG